MQIEKIPCSHPFNLFAARSSINKYIRTSHLRTAHRNSECQDVSVRNFTLFLSLFCFIFRYSSTLLGYSLNFSLTPLLACYSTFDVFSVLHSFLSRLLLPMDFNCFQFFTVIKSRIANRQTTNFHTIQICRVWCVVLCEWYCFVSYIGESEFKNESSSCKKGQNRRKNI